MKETRTLLWSARGSICLNLLMATYKIWLAIALRSELLFIYAFYNLGIVMSKTTFLANVKHNKDKYYLVGITVSISSLCFIIYSIKLMVTGANRTYDTYMSVLMTVAVLLEMAISIYGVISARKKNNIKVETIKLTSLASNVISLSLTQTAVFSFITHIDASKYNGITGVVFGLIATIIGIYMIIYIRKNTQVEE